VRSAIAGSDAVVNAVGLYVEKGDATFKSIHIDGARRVAALAQESGVERLVHLSGIGSDATSRSPYIRSRGQGEEAVREAMGRASLFRPSVLFAKDDSFLNTLVSLVQRAPVIPLFGNGETRLQPVFAGDVAQAVAQALTQTEAPSAVYELGGPDILSYRAILRQVMEAIDRRPVLLPVPFFAWDALAAAFSVLRAPMITEGQVALLKHDNVAAPDMPGLDALNVSACPLEAVLKEIASPA